MQTCIWTLEFTAQASEGLKTLESGGLAPLHVQMLDSRPPGPLPQVVDEVLEVGLFTFSHHFNPPIGQVLGVAREAKLKGFLAGKVTVAHPLHLPTDQHGYSQHDSNLHQRQVQTGPCGAGRNG